MSNVELYEALKGSISNEGARLIAEVAPPVRDLATKADIAELRGEIRALPTTRWMLGLFVPVWFGVWGTVIAVILKG